MNGFVGHHVAHALNEKGIKVLGVSNQVRVEPDLENIVDDYISCDLTSPDEVSKIDLSEVNAIINLAGFAKVGDSRGQGELYDRVNIGVHTVLYDECIKQGVNPRIIAVSTGAVYDPRQSLPITEESALIDMSETNEYVVSKQLMEKALNIYIEAGLDIIIARPFNHSGPGQLPGFLLPDLGAQISAAKKNNQPIYVGNLETKRDYTDVRDVARAYVELATATRSRLKHRIYNICSGKSVSGNTILDKMKTAFGADNLEIIVDIDKLRPNEVMDIYGSYETQHNATGWEPEISVGQMIEDYANWKLSII